VSAILYRFLNLTLYGYLSVHDVLIARSVFERNPTNMSDEALAFDTAAMNVTDVTDESDTALWVEARQRESATQCGAPRSIYGGSRDIHPRDGGSQFRSTLRLL
jgi:hypothetical protein